MGFSRRDKKFPLPQEGRAPALGNIRIMAGRAPVSGRRLNTWAVAPAAKFSEYFNRFSHLISQPTAKALLHPAGVRPVPRSVDAIGFADGPGRCNAGTQSCGRQERFRCQRNGQRNAQSCSRRLIHELQRGKFANAERLFSVLWRRAASVDRLTFRKSNFFSRC